MILTVGAFRTTNALPNRHCEAHKQSPSITSRHLRRSNLPIRTTIVLAKFKKTDIPFNLEIATAQITIVISISFVDCASQ